MGRLLAFRDNYASPKGFCSVPIEFAKRVEMLQRLPIRKPDGR